jgi:hypothetical protein
MPYISYPTILKKYFKNLKLLKPIQNMLQGPLGLTYATKKKSTIVIKDYTIVNLKMLWLNLHVWKSIKPLQIQLNFVTLYNQEQLLTPKGPLSL